MSNINSKVFYLNDEEEYTNNSLTNDEECVLQNLLNRKDLEYLIEKKDFYKKQLENLYDMEKQIQKFQKQTIRNISDIQKILFKKCKHDWVKYSEGGYDESPDYICCICENSYYD